MKRATALALTVALILATAVAPRAEALQLRCHPVHVVQAAGSGFSHSWHPVARETLFDDASSPADDLQIRFGARTVSTFQVKYPASLGRFSAFGTAGVPPEGTEAATYGESVRYGRDVATLELETVARQCPSTRFIMVGYSQGAQVVGDAAAEVAAGRVHGVGPDQIAGVVMFSDPARARLAAPAEPERPSRLYARPPKGVRGANYETVVPGGTTIDPTFVGMAGTRTVSFNGLGGKILSECNGADMACATPPDSVIRTLADVATRDEWTGPFNAITGIRVARFQRLLQDGVPVPEAFAQSGFSPIDAILVPQLALELGEAFVAVVDHLRAASPTPLEQQAAIALLAALPELAKEGVAWPWLFQALYAVRGLLPDAAVPAYDLALTTCHALEAAERLEWQLQRMGALPQSTTGTQRRREVAHAAVSRLSYMLIDASGLRPAYNDPANANLLASAKIAGDFGPRHMSYYKLGYTDIPGGYRVDGQTGYDYAMGWLGDVVRGVVDAAG